MVLAVGISAQTVTTKDGVYSKPQAERAKALWTKTCASCHTLGDLSTATSPSKGPALSGEAFLTKWNGKTVFALADGIQKTMPNDFSVELTAPQAADVTSLILQMNGFPAGEKELAPGETQKTITIVK
jgi:mono/diheme cytochrome c family protein